jgi:hypothetical protein
VARVDQGTAGGVAHGCHLSSAGRPKIG